MNAKYKTAARNGVKKMFGLIMIDDYENGP